MRKITIGLLTLFLLAGCSREGFDTEKAVDNPESKVASFDENVAVPGQVIVKLAQEPADENSLIVTRNGGAQVNTGLVSLDRIASEIGASGMRRMFRPIGKFEARTREAGLHLWYVVDFDEDIPVTRAANQLATSEYIALVEPMVIVERVGTLDYTIIDDLGALLAQTRALEADDPMFSMQWHYNNDGTRTNCIAGADIRLAGAWEYTTGHPDVIVNVVDGGIGFAHPDIAANMWINQAEAGGAEGVDDDGNGYADDVYGYNFVFDSGEIIGNYHGTHVAGTIAAVTNNGVGVAGIAGGDGTPGSGVRLMSSQIFHDDISGLEYQANVAMTLEAIKYGADNGAVISQNSWGYPAGSVPSTLSSYREVINYFIQYAGKDENGNQVGPLNGGLVVFAAGNDASGALCYPAAIEGVISVASFGSNYKTAYYTNYGSYVTISAPGGDYTMGTSNQVLSTFAGYSGGRYLETYGYYQGTSMACPHVSGVLALYISQYGVGQPGLTPEKVKQRMIDTAFQEVYDYNPGFAGMLGAGGIDATRMLEPEDTPQPSVPEVIASFGTVRIDGLGQSKAFALGDYFRDPDGGTLVYNASPDRQGVVTPFIMNNNLTITSVGTGLVKVEVTATNLSGQSVSSVLTVIVDGGSAPAPENPGEIDKGDRGEINT